MNFLRPKVAMKLSEFRDEFKENVSIVADLGRPAVGRPRHSVIGDRRLQITRDVSAQIAAAMIENIEASGKVLEPAGQFLYCPSKRAEQAARWVNDMAKVNREATDEDPFRLVEKMYGTLLTVAYRKPTGQKGRAEPVRILTCCATPIDQRIAADYRLKKGRRENRLDEAAAMALRAVADMSSEGERFDEAMARHYDSIRKGEV
ncbi:hypothetical protein [Ochrobactrum sp. A-1]|uniref:hypothetical protein n=1 Tax=Ochrobactrum sp. A-1 TaxID=2920940 RepID=UPI001F0B0360|nr:hypothetical protein [Ochrobactrum sp. A-1]